MQDVVVIYYLPNRDFTPARKLRDEWNADLNILQAFSEACRNDLRD